jgi:hypothetical protein
VSVSVSQIPSTGPSIAAANGKGKIKLIDRGQLDRRTAASKKFDAIASAIAEDLGGSDRLSTVQKHLVEAFAGVALAVNDLNARLLLGEEIDLIEQTQAVSTMVRVAQRIGINRVARDVGGLGELLRRDYEQQQREKQAC